MTPWERAFRENMMRIRTDRGMSQTELARALKNHGLPFHQQTVQRVEVGDRPIRLNEAFVISQILNVDMGMMTMRVSPDSEYLRQSVEKVQRKARVFVEDSSEVLSDLLSAAVDLIHEVWQSVSLYEQLDGAESPREMDKLTEWGVAFAIRVATVTRTLFLNGVMGTMALYENGVVFDPGTETVEALMRPELWSEQFPKSLELSQKSYADLMAAFPVSAGPGDDRQA